MTGFIKTLTEIWREEIPLSPFTNKIEEGLAKQAPPAVIQQVMQKKLDDYRFTRTLVQEILKKRGPGPGNNPIRLSPAFIGEYFLRYFKRKFAIPY